MKRSFLFFMCLMMAFSFSSCTLESSSGEKIVYNSSTKGEFTDGGKYIFANIVDDSKSKNYIQNKSDGKVTEFIRDAFYDDKTTDSYVDNILVDADHNKGYYMDTSETEDNRGFAIKQFDLLSFKQKEIYRENFIWHKSVFLGLGQDSDTELSKEDDFSDKLKTNSEKYMLKPQYFVEGGKVYIIRRDDGIYCVDLRSKKKEKLITGNRFMSVSSDGDFIYYIDEFYDLYKYSLKSHKKVKLSKDKVSNEMITKDKLIYLNLSDNNSIYVMDRDGSHIIKAEGSSVFSMNCDDKYIYYSNEDDKNHLYRVKFDGTGNEKMGDFEAYSVYPFKNFNKLYVMGSRTGGVEMFSVDKESYKVENIKF